MSTVHATKNTASAHSGELSARPKLLSDGERHPACLAFARAMRAAGVSQSQVVDALGVSPALVASWCLTAPIHLGHVLRLAGPLPRLYHELLEVLGDLASPQSAPDELRGALGVQHEAGALAGAVVAAVADGVIDEAEVRELDRCGAKVAAASRRFRGCVRARAAGAR